MVKRKFTLKTMLWNKCNGYNQNIKSSNFIENVLHTFTHSRIQPHLFTLHYCLLKFCGSSLYVCFTLFATPCPQTCLSHFQ